MPVMKVYEHGATAGFAPTCNDHQRAKRGAVCGWSYRSIRANTQFLYAVRERGLTGSGLALTLTLRDCPPSHREWARMVRAFIERLRRLGMLRLHWLTEWQRRRCPHLHCAVWFEQDSKWLRETVLDAWLAVSAPFGARRGSQTAEPISDAIGWFQYVSKHASRGLGHYQRAGSGIPPGWQTTGRMWGHVGDWPLIDAQRFDISGRAFWAFRRMVRAWRRSDARSTGNARRISQARRMLSCPDPGLSAVRGVSEWLEFDMTMRLLVELTAQGYHVEYE